MRKLQQQVKDQQKQIKQLEKAVKCLVQYAIAEGSSEKAHWALEADKYV